MESKEDLIRVMSKTLLRIMAKHARIEELPVVFDKGIELTPREIHILQMIGEHQNVTVTELATIANVTKSATSQMVAKLANRGLLRKAFSGENNKELRLSLTKLGEKAFCAHQRIHGQHMAEVVQRLGAFSLPQIAAASCMLEVIETVVSERLAQFSKGEFFWDEGTAA